MQCHAKRGSAHHVSFCVPVASHRRGRIRLRDCLLISFWISAIEPYHSQSPRRIASAVLRPFMALYFCSTSVENLVVPSSEISTRGAVPLIPIVPTGVSTFMSPVCATLPAMKVNVPLVKLIKLEFECPLGS